MNSEQPLSNLTLTCIECDSPFVHSAGEQQFFARMQFAQPRRCRPCRQAQRERKQRLHQASTLVERTEHGW